MIVLARAAAPGVELVAIDPHAGNDRGPQEIEGFVDEAAEDHDVFNANLARAGVRRPGPPRADGSPTRPTSRSTTRSTCSTSTAPTATARARADIRDWGARVRLGGTMLIHDSFSSVGVTLAILRELLPGSRWRYVGRSGSMTEYRRERLGAKARVANAVHQSLELPWFARNVLIKVLITVKLGAAHPPARPRPVHLALLIPELAA